LQELAALAPRADPAEARKTVEEGGDPWMLVGHLPHLERLASLLLTGDADGDLFVVAAASLLRLERIGEPWRLRAMLPPSFLASSPFSAGPPHRGAPAEKGE
jgi:phosphohistidine phosphatase